MAASRAQLVAFKQSWATFSLAPVMLLNEVILSFWACVPAGRAGRLIMAEQRAQLLRHGLSALHPRLVEPVHVPQGAARAHSPPSTAG